MASFKKPPRDYYGALQALCNTEMWEHMEPGTQEFCMAMLVKYSGTEVFETPDVIALHNRRVRFMHDTDTGLFTAFFATWNMINEELDDAVDWQDIPL